MYANCNQAIFTYLLWLYNVPLTQRISYLWFRHFPPELKMNTLTKFKRRAKSMSAIRTGLLHKSHRLWVSGLIYKGRVVKIKGTI